MTAPQSDEVQRVSASRAPRAEDSETSGDLLTCEESHIWAVRDQQLCTKCTCCLYIFCAGWSSECIYEHIVPKPRQRVFNLFYMITWHQIECKSRMFVDQVVPWLPLYSLVCLSPSLFFMKHNQLKLSQNQLTSGKCYLTHSIKWIWCIMHISPAVIY